MVVVVVVVVALQVVMLPWNLQVMIITKLELTFMTLRLEARITLESGRGHQLYSEGVSPVRAEHETGGVTSPDIRRRVRIISLLKT
ncbi:hypothetical protein E2C01_030367 [Portunus trituberculatus]|uniref:Uncharacterized protein n=1 Tax=Portunus trituberculatus TaxID=210409 RepID=A0A5B7EUP4_PORTR|nr:hypothetical protein [Portunus trituberculatus]